MFQTTRVWAFADNSTAALRLRASAEQAARSAQLGVSALREAVLFSQVGEIVDVLENETLARLFDSVAVVEWDASTEGWPPTKERVRNLVGVWRLLLLFPEIHWIFILPGEDGSATDSVDVAWWEGVRTEFCSYHIVRRRADDGESAHAALERLLLIHMRGFRPLFDPFGVRRHLSGLHAAGKGLSIEDEPSFCLLNGYFLFRTGLATSLAATGKEFERQLRRLRSGNPGEWCLIEDVELYYADTGVGEATDLAICGRDDENLSQLLLRRGSTWSLNNCRARVLVTGLDIATQDLFHASQLNNVRVRQKPYCGFYDRALSEVLEGTLDKGLDLMPEKERLFSHSPLAPNQAVALRLLERVRSVSGESCSLLEALCGAVIMETAEELLRERPVHLAAEAIIRRHEFEVASESAWVGMTASPTLRTVRERYRHLERQIELTVSKAGGTSRLTGHLARLRSNLMLHACASIRRIFEAHDRKTEDDFFLGKYRKWYRREWKRRSDNPGGGGNEFAVRSFFLAIGRRVANVAFAYLNLLMGGWYALAGSGVAWILVFGGVYQWLSAQAGQQLSKILQLNFGDWVVQSVTVFSGLAYGLDGGLSGRDFFSPDGNLFDPGRLWVLKSFWIASAVEALIGVVHIGVFITLLVQKFLRR